MLGHKRRRSTAGHSGRAERKKITLVFPFPFLHPSDHHHQSTTLDDLILSSIRAQMSSIRSIPLEAVNRRFARISAPFAKKPRTRISLSLRCIKNRAAAKYDITLSEQRRQKTIATFFLSIGPSMGGPSIRAVHLQAYLHRIFTRLPTLHSVTITDEVNYTRSNFRGRSEIDDAFLQSANNCLKKALLASGPIAVRRLSLTSCYAEELGSTLIGDYLLVHCANSLRTVKVRLAESENVRRRLKGVSAGIVDRLFVKFAGCQLLRRFSFWYPIYDWHQPPPNYGTDFSEMLYRVLNDKRHLRHLLLPSNEWTEKLIESENAGDSIAARLKSLVLGGDVYQPLFPNHHSMEQYLRPLLRTLSESATLTVVFSGFAERYTATTAIDVLKTLLRLSSDTQITIKLILGDNNANRRWLTGLIIEMHTNAVGLSDDSSEIILRDGNGRITVNFSEVYDAWYQ